MFDREFFRDHFPERVAEYGSLHGVQSVTVLITARDGAEFNVREINSGDAGARLVTIDGKMVFLPYGDFARIEVSPTVEEASQPRHFPTGFQLPSP